MKQKLLLTILALLGFGLAEVHAQSYLNNRSRWTEIRLDTLLYDSWYSAVETEEGTAYVPNFEIVEYKINSEMQAFEYEWGSYDLQDVIATTPDGHSRLVCYRCYSLDKEGVYQGTYDQFTHIAIRNQAEPFAVMEPAETYCWADWNVGEDLYFIDLFTSQTTGFPRTTPYGKIVEVGKDFFGGAKPLEYALLDNGRRIIKGIGVTTWNGKECIVGPAYVNECADWYVNDNILQDEAKMDEIKNTHHRSMLVRFEHDGEVLYNMWPNAKGEITQGVPQIAGAQKAKGIYDLQGRKLTRQSDKGLYIEDGKVMTR
ncbi:MAG: hypothetical protein UHS50_10750 [Bacteroidaceae bacterium]|nr:hypothetical protein [Bacteroidaceae bacterium]